MLVVSRSVRVNVFPVLRLAILSLVACLLSGAIALAAPDQVAGRRTALVIGNTHYRSLPQLPNGVNDARRVKAVLEQANFDVVLGEDLDGKGLEKTIREYLRSLNDGDVALFYYSGHAAQVAGENYILPVDASLDSPYDLEVQAYNVGNLLSYMRQSSALQIAILDACRDNPFKSGFYYVGNRKVDVSGNKGLAPPSPNAGSLIVYSTAPDQVAYDGTGTLSPFTGSFTDNALTPNLEVRDLITRIRNEVIRKTGGKQVPWDVSSLTTAFYFVTHQNLLIMQDMTEVRLPPRAQRMALGIPEPISSGDTPLTVAFKAMPARGTVWLGDRKLDLSARIPADQLGRLAYEPDPADRSVETIDYSVDTGDGRAAKGSVRITLDPDAPAPGGAEPRLAIVAGSGDDQGTVKVKPTLIAMAADVGTGFAGVPDNAASGAASGAGSSAASGTAPAGGSAGAAADSAKGGWLRLKAHDPGTQVALAGKVVSEGDLVRAADVSRLAIRPSLAVAGKDVGVSLVPAVAHGGAERPVAITVAVSVNKCDQLAGEPFDIQGVTEGVLPNEIDVAAAKEACKSATGDYPDVARFKYEYGRALYADSEFDAALAEFRAAYDQGHVRAGEILGRLYQMGVGVERNPAKAVSLFEAGAKKGDPYAQYSLGKALILGNGTKQDVARGMELLTKAAESGHTYAMNQLGFEYRFGTHVAKDPERAWRLFQKSADRGDVWGMYNLGLLYRDGVAVKQDDQRAMELFRKANAGGQPYAPAVIGLMLAAEGKTSPAKLLDWYRQGSARGDAWGSYLAAELLMKNPSLATEPGEAVGLYALAASHDAEDVSDRARKALARIPDARIVAEIGKVLARLGHPLASAKEIRGKAGRQAASAILGAGAPRQPRDLLIALSRKEWIQSRPRLDML